MPIVPLADLSIFIAAPAKIAESERQAKAEAIRGRDEASRASEEAARQRKNAEKALTQSVLQTSNEKMNRGDSKGAIAYLASYLRVLPSSKPIGVRLTSGLADRGLVFPTHVYSGSNYFRPSIFETQFLTRDGQQLITFSSTRVSVQDSIRGELSRETPIVKVEGDRKISDVQYSSNSRRLLTVTQSGNDIPVPLNENRTRELLSHANWLREESELIQIGGAQQTHDPRQIGRLT